MHRRSSTRASAFVRRTLGKSGLSKSAFTRCRRSTSSMWVLLRASYCRRYADPISGASSLFAAQIRILSRLNVAVRMCAVAPVFFTRRTCAHPLKGEEAECIRCLTNGAYFSVFFYDDGGKSKDSQRRRVVRGFFHKTLTVTLHTHYRHMRACGTSACVQVGCAHVHTTERHACTRVRGRLQA